MGVSVTSRDEAQAHLLQIDFANYQLQQRTRAVFDTTHHAVTLELLSRSGASVKQSVASSFPMISGGHDEHRERFQIKNETSVKWWLENKKIVMTKPDHLPTVDEKKKFAAEMEAWIDKHGGDESHDLPERLKLFPRPMCREPPAHGEEAPMGLQVDLEREVDIVDKQLYRVKVLGLAGTNGQTYTTEVFSGKQIRDRMDRTFKARKQYLRQLQNLLDKEPTGTNPDTDHCSELISGAMITLDDGCLSDKDGMPPRDKAMLGAIHAAWSSSDAKSRKLVITGLFTGHIFSRPRRPEVEVESDVCATCLEDIAGEAWRCGTCNKTQHLDCFDGWRRMCVTKKCAVTCPNCRAEV